MDDDLYDNDEDISIEKIRSKRREAITTYAVSDTNNTLDPRVEDVLSAFDSAVNDKDLLLEEKMQSILKMHTTITSKLLRNLTSNAPDVDESVVAARAVISLKEVSNLLIKQQEREENSYLDVSSPKFKEAISYFLDDIYEVMSEYFNDAESVSGFFRLLSTTMAGWEVSLDKRLNHGLVNKRVAKDTHTQAAKDFVNEEE